MSDLGNCLQVENVVAGVSDGFNEYRLGLVINGSSEVLDLLPIDELGVDPETREQDLELIVCSSVKVGGGNDVIPGMSKGRDGQELRGLARGSCDGCDTTFESCNTFLEDINGRLDKFLECSFKRYLRVLFEREPTFIIRL